MASAVCSVSTGAMAPDAKLLAIEINPKFCELLRESIDDPRLIVHEGSAAEIPDALVKHELDAPEFFDRSLFRAFLDQLRKSGVVWSDSHNCLAFDGRINDVERDAQIVLSEQIRHSILQVTHR